MKRRVIQRRVVVVLLLLLAGGAIVNVAVAWGGTSVSGWRESASWTEYDALVRSQGMYFRETPTVIATVATSLYTVKSTRSDDAHTRVEMG